uniref:Mce/MlaD domain-containing protein n=1 Tax=Acrosorium ciliolatum TaxID=1550622 RepID=A0A1Z1M2E0_9FLOR|nr:hypothetical protein [Acrosorium ciliolatum]ARW59954.1 hypothetical protein [Acrosorium ciliolatum]
MNFRFKYTLKNLNNVINFLIFTLFILVLLSFVNTNLKKKQGYLLFIEFNNAYGIKEGTSVNLRGVKIGSVEKIKMKVNSLIVLVFIESPSILIPKCSIIETNQTGLFNDTSIDIIPLVKLKYNRINVFSKTCLNSDFLCNNHYLIGNRGLNYDDLVRAATRISQRFDDPRFFNLIYLFIKNGINISDEILFSINNISYFIYFFTKLTEIIFSGIYFN